MRDRPSDVSYLELADEGHGIQHRIPVDNDRDLQMCIASDRDLPDFLSTL